MLRDVRVGASSDVEGGASRDVSGGASAQGCKGRGQQ